jgi:hypothetical protein
MKTPSHPPNPVCRTAARSQASGQPSFDGCQWHPTGRIKFGGVLTLFAILLLLTTSVTFAQKQPVDKVVLQRKRSGSRITHSGIVVDFTGTKLTIRSRDNTSVSTYDADEVVEVRTPQTEQHRKGLNSFAQGDMERAVASFELAMIEETRDWVRRDILAMLVRCALRRGDLIAAGSKFLALWQSDQTTRQFKLAPLTWGTHNITAALRSESLGWINLNTEASRLLGASHLLADVRHTALAKNEMNELASSINLRIRLLARAQLWRLRVREGNLTPSEMKRWQSKIEDMPENIRGGPFYVLGRGHLVRKEYDRAAAALLWVPLVYDDDTHLAARACLEAADALREVGQSGQSRALYREVTTRFVGTPFADEAASLLKSEESTPAKTSRDE